MGMRLSWEDMGMRGTCFELRESDVRGGQRGIAWYWPLPTLCPESSLGCRERALAPLRVSTDYFNDPGRQG